MSFNIATNSFVEEPWHAAKEALRIAHRLAPGVVATVRLTLDGRTWGSCEMREGKGITLVIDASRPGDFSALVAQALAAQDEWFPRRQWWRLMGSAFER